MPSASQPQLAPSTRLEAPEHPFVREEVVRLLLQSLSDLGYHASFDALQKESGVHLESPAMQPLREAVLQGMWDKAERHFVDLTKHTSLHMPASDAALEWPCPKEQNVRERALASVRYLLHKQQYLELLEHEQKTEALHVLRTVLSKLSLPPTILQELSRLILCRNAQELYEQAKWDGALGQSRRQLLSTIESVLDTSSMVPNRRWHVLYEQALAFQRMQSPYFVCDSLNDSRRLLVDYQADPAQFPSHLSYELDGHTDEVWTIRFSHTGTKLASGGRDGLVNIWDMSTKCTPVLQLQHKNGVQSIDWSHDDAKLIVAADEDVALWDIATRHVKLLTEHEYTVSAVRWLPDPTRRSHGDDVVFVTGAMDQKVLFRKADGTVAWTWSLSPYRVIALDVTADGRYVVAVGQRSITPQVSQAPLGVHSRRRRGGQITNMLPTSMSNSSWIPFDARPPALRNTSDSLVASFLFPGTEEDEEAVSSRRAEPNAPRVEEQTQVFIYDVCERAEVGSIHVKGNVNYVTISPDSRCALLSEAGGAIHLLDLHTRSLTQCFQGRHAAEDVLRPAFGGYGSQYTESMGPLFVLSGSKDGRIIAWHRLTGKQLDLKCRHKFGSVNEVAWQNGDPTMMVSSGDDGTVRVWLSHHNDAPSTCTKVSVPASIPTAAAPSRREPCTSRDQAYATVQDYETTMEQGIPNEDITEESSAPLSSAPRPRLWAPSSAETPDHERSGNSNAQARNSADVPDSYVSTTATPRFFPW
ncbi:GID complex protein [Malassezia pachydermatis]